MTKDFSVPQDYSLRKLTLYFLKLGAIGFGGPVALIGYMQNDLVTEKKWISHDEYSEGLSLAQLAPGPLATQLAIYLGWTRNRILGATLVGLAFILPSFLIVLVLAKLYIQFNGLPIMQSLFFGIGPAVIAIISLSAWKLVKKTLIEDKVLWLIALVSALATIVTESESIATFLAAGVLYVIFKKPTSFKNPSQLRAIISPWLCTGLNGPAASSTVTKMLLYFMKAGSMVFGSGLAIVPFLHGGVVDRFQWLSENQFLDAVAVAMITPGPVVITVAFIGYLVAGLVGATTAAAGVFLPCYLFVVIPAPFYKKIVKFERIKFFVTGVTAAAIGAIIGSVFILGKRSIHDRTTFIISALTLGCLLKVKRIPEPVLVLLAGLVGVVIHRV